MIYPNMSPLYASPTVAVKHMIAIPEAMKPVMSSLSSGPANNDPIIIPKKQEETPVAAPSDMPTTTTKPEETKESDISQVVVPPRPDLRVTKEERAAANVHDQGWSDWMDTDDKGAGDYDYTGGSTSSEFFYQAQLRASMKRAASERPSIVKTGSSKSLKDRMKGFESPF
jgi:hypothetical protein